MIRNWIGHESDIAQVSDPTLVVNKLYNGISELRTTIVNNKSNDIINKIQLNPVNFSISYVPNKDLKGYYGTYIKEIIIAYFKQNICSSFNISYIYSMTDYSLNVTTFYPYVLIPNIPKSSNAEINPLNIKHVWDMFSDQERRATADDLYREVPMYGKMQNIRIPTFGEVLGWRLVSNNPLTLATSNFRDIESKIKYWKGLFLIPIEENEDIAKLDDEIIESVQNEILQMKLQSIFSVKICVTLKNDYIILSELCESFGYKIISRNKIESNEWVFIQCPKMAEYANDKFFHDALANLLDDRPIVVYHSCSHCNNSPISYVKSRYALEAANADVLGGKYSEYIEVLSSGMLVFPAFSHRQFLKMVERFKVHYNQDREVSFNPMNEVPGWKPITCDLNPFAWIKGSSNFRTLSNEELQSEIVGLLSLASASSRNGLTINFNALENNFLFYKPNGTVKRWNDGKYISIWGREYYNQTKKVSAAVVL